MGFGSADNRRTPAGNWLVTVTCVATVGPKKTRRLSIFTVWPGRYSRLAKLDVICRSPGAVAVNTASLADSPSGVMMASGPVEAFDGTRAINSLADLRSNSATPPPNFKKRILRKPLPRIVTMVLAGPIVGSNESIRGNTANELVLINRPPGATNSISPPSQSSPTVNFSLSLAITSNGTDCPPMFSDVSP